MITLPSRGLALASLTLSLTGCGLVLGLGDFKEGTGGGGGNGGEGGGGGSAGSCSDAVKNGTEADVDCGGACAPCLAGAGCSEGADCESKSCKDQLCLAPTCSDKLVNGAETDQDCGGSECPACANDASCSASTDCESAVCHTGVCAQSLVWAKRFGSPNAMGSTTSHAVAIDASGNAVLVGEMSGTVDFGGGVLTTSGGPDIFLAKLGPDGKHVWSKLIASAGAESLTGVAVDPQGNILVTGDYDSVLYYDGGKVTSAGNGDVIVAKLDQAGSVKWFKSFGDAQPDRSCGVATDGAGDVFVTGIFYGKTSFGGAPLTSAGSADIYLAKLDPAGGHLWSKSFGNSVDQFVSGIAANTAGNVAITGQFQGTVDFGKGPLQAAAIDIFVAKLDPAGNTLWSKRFGTKNYNEGQSLVMDGGGNVIVTGRFSGTVDFGNGPLNAAASNSAFVAKLDPSGTALWSRRFGAESGSYSAEGATVALDPAGNVIVTGTFEGTADFGGGQLISSGERDYYVVKLDASGKYLWSNHFGNNSDQLHVTTAVYDSTSIALTGDLRGTIDLGGVSVVGPTEAMFNLDTFLARMLTP